MGMHQKVVTWFTPDEPSKAYVEVCKKSNWEKLNSLLVSGRKCIVLYVRDSEGNRAGTLVAYPSTEGSFIRIGWSALNTKRDKWNKHVGLAVALRRAEQDHPEDLPALIYDAVGEFYGRCMRYFRPADYGG